jgi:REP element-mobilizing transposase RayT
MGFSFLKNYKKEFGGSLLTGKRKCRRPLSTKHPIHLILKTGRAKLFHPANNDLVKIIKSDAQKFGVKIYDVAVNWSHIHLLIQLPSRDAYNRFIRSITSRLVAYFERKSGWNLKGLFDLRPYTRILTWGKQMITVLNYSQMNKIEAKFGRRARNLANSDHVMTIEYS